MFRASARATTPKASVTFVSEGEPSVERWRRLSYSASISLLIFLAWLVAQPLPVPGHLGVGAVKGKDQLFFIAVRILDTGPGRKPTAF